MFYNPGTSWHNNDAFAARKEDGTVAAWGEDEIVYHNNPMIEESHSEDTVPLLQRVDNVEYRTESIEAKTESIEAKTERMEEKFKLALEEMNKKMEKMANSGNIL